MPARAELAGWRDDVCARSPALRPVVDASLHVTLVFLGWQDDAAAVASAVRAGLEGSDAIPLEVEEGRAVPPRGARLLAASLADPTGRCGALAGRLAEALSGFREPERRAFWPHVTVARVRRGERFRGPVEPQPPPLELVCAEVVLYRSHLRREGARYESLDRHGLGARS